MDEKREREPLNILGHLSCLSFRKHLPALVVNALLFHLFLLDSSSNRLSPLLRSLALTFGLFFFYVTFTTFNQDKDGYLTTEELLEALRAIGQSPTPVRMERKLSVPERQ